MVELVWRRVPSEVRAAAAEPIEELLPLVPWYVRRLIVDYDGEEAEAWASIETDLNNREATLAIHGKWLSQGYRDRVHTLLHEVVHIWLEPLDEVLLDLYRVLEPDESAGRFLSAQRERIIERMVEDICTVVMPLLDD